MGAEMKLSRSKGKLGLPLLIILNFVVPHERVTVETVGERKCSVVKELLQREILTSCVRHLSAAAQVEGEK